MKDKAIAYFNVKGDVEGSYALIPKVVSRKPGIVPKNFLIKLTPQKQKELKKESTPFFDASSSCIFTRTGARLCYFKSQLQDLKHNLTTNKQIELEGIEMCRPVYELSQIVKTGKSPTIEECRKADKVDFLIISCKPEEFCR